ncbi:phasin-related domain-containing protein [Litorimonas sp. WD9-15]|uniref:phasin-related domain-containing protein n=1 Tax=Litorimonas sp. WD9-15 TaxID=3418716 RepID=UPI003D07AABE
MAKSSDDKDMVRKIWLAGIGAYGRAFTEAKGAVDSLTGKSSEVFDDLVQKGEMLETVGKYKSKELLGKGKSAVEDIKPDFEIDDRIAKMRARLSGMGESGTDKLAKRVDAMEAKLDAILAKLDAPEKKVAKRAAPKKKMTTQKTKAAPKKKS